MKYLSILILLFVFTHSTAIMAKTDTSKYGLSSEQLIKQEKELDKQIKSLIEKIEKISIENNLENKKDITIIPFQTNFKNEKGVISLEKYFLRKNSNYANKVTGISTKKIILKFSGKSLSSIESFITDKDYRTGEKTYVHIVDNSPKSNTYDNIKFLYKYNGKTILQNKTMSKIKNTTAFPIRNNLKRDFLIPHLTFFYDSLVFITESYSKSKKDADSDMSGFLKDSTK